MELPSWLWFGLYYGANPSAKWNEEKENVGQEILKKLIEKARQHDWNIDKIIEFNKYDDANIYGTTPKNNIN